MPLPASITRAGYQTAAALRPANRLRRLLIGCEGFPDTGKTEFALSAPGPGICLCLDRGIDPIFDNPSPPPTRNPDFAFKVISIPQQTAEKQDTFKEYWGKFRDEVKTIIGMPEVRTLVIDGDSDSWELQRMAAFGKLTQVRSHNYTEVNAARRAFYARLWDSGKIIIATNKLKKLYKPVWNLDGTPKLDDANRQLREWDGKSYERQGFDDQEYLWQIQLSHLYKPTPNPTWGFKIIKCKADRSVEGLELWGADCNFKSLVSAVYPDVPLREWGYV